MAERIFGNHPFTEKKKDKPIHIKGDLIGKFIYPDDDLIYSDLNFLYLSTDELTIVMYELGPGGNFNPPDYHPGDEVYIVLEGTLTMLNAESGEVVQVKRGESLLMPKGAIHVGYNFEKEKVRTLAILAPRVAEDQKFPVDADGKIKVYKGKNNDSFKTFDPLDEKIRHRTLDDIGEWPIPGPNIRKYPHFFYHIPEEKALNAIAGVENPVLMKFFVSNDFIHVGKIIIPMGGKGVRKSDMDAHAGDCCLYLEKGPLTVFISDTKEVFYIKDREALYIPKNTSYQLLNYEHDVITAIFAISKL